MILKRTAVSWALVIAVGSSVLTASSVFSRNYSSRELAPTQRPYVISGRKYYPIPSADGYSERGVASWYGPKFHGRKTSNGETYNMHKLTAAHKLLPMGTVVLVKNLANGREVTVRINDRGPFAKKRIIDLSNLAAKKLDIIRSGTAKVEVIALGEYHAKPGGKSYLKAKDLKKGKYFVQIGSFTVQSNAYNLKRKFEQAGHKAVIQRFFKGKQIFYRVQIFVGNGLRQARSAEKSLWKKGYQGAFLIAR
ncbi:MAG: septal ring lytic transglycosylase RlpA family protein [Thermodesulfobacteriota bacterium]